MEIKSRLFEKLIFSVFAIILLIIIDSYIESDILNLRINYTHLENAILETKILLHRR